MPDDFICLGIDPGLARVGYGAVMQSGIELRALNYGCITTTPDMRFTDRLLVIYDSLQEQINLCSPDLISVERLFFGRNTTTAEYVYQARGVVMLLSAMKNIPVIEPKPNQIKLKLCGTGKADKKQIQLTVQSILNLESMPRPDDTADALAAAITGLTMLKDEGR